MAVRLSALGAGHPLHQGRSLTLISVKRFSRPQGHNASGGIGVYIIMDGEEYVKENVLRL
jgi:hypothetical protein